jgi:ABC-type multidrug transport system fused ATPase/permease subunit
VSGGQAQRICLARALAGRPEILLLDEPTSALDPASERLIQESLVGLKGSTTLVIIAHRMSTLDLCDRVMVIVGGALDAFEDLDVIGAENAYYRAAGGEPDKALPVAEGRQPLTGTTPGTASSQTAARPRTPR